MDNIWNNYPVIKRDLEQVTKIMQQNVKCREKLLQDALLDLINSGGKLLRPAFLILSSRFGEYESKEVHSLAAVMEMLHMATLVHDDVIDDAKLRRGKETIQSKYGKNLAVYIGDYLFCICFRILANTNAIKNIKLDSNSMARICLGEVEQYSSKYKQNITVRQYLKRISCKTAELFSLSFYTGALEGKCSEKMARLLSSVGHNIGMAFQIIDDLLDYTGNDEKVRKSTYNDLKQGIFTLPLVYAMETNNKELSVILSKKEFSDEDISRILEILYKSGSLEKTRLMAKTYTKKAFGKIEKLPDGENKKILFEITQKLLEREY